MIVENFSADWCNPCKGLNKIFEELKIEYPNIEFKYVNVDENRDYAVANGIRTLPTVIFKSDEGVELDKIIGLELKENYQEKIKNLL